jgi:membrane-associated phospholipid phosphatase
MTRGVVCTLLWLLVLARPVQAQPRPVTQWSDWASYGTALGNPAAAAVAAWRSDHRLCALGQLALSEGVGNGITIWSKHVITSPRPCLGCDPDGSPSGHTMNSVIGFSRWSHGWVQYLVAGGLAAATGWLRHDAGRHFWRQIGEGALLGVGAEAAGQLIRCPTE